jgi:hypothetical protein
VGLTSNRPDLDEDDQQIEEPWDDQCFEEYYSSQESEEIHSLQTKRMKRMTTQIYMSQDQEGGQDHQTV